MGSVIEGGGSWCSRNAQVEPLIQTGVYGGGGFLEEAMLPLSLKEERESEEASEGPGSRKAGTGQGEWMDRKASVGSLSSP